MKVALLLLAPFLALPLDAQCETQRVSAAQLVTKDFFGKACAIEGNRAVMGAYSAENASPGSVYVFETGGLTWVQKARLTPTDVGGSNDQFGNSVGLSGDTIVVGSEFNTNANGNSAGAAYVYENIGGTWMGVAKLIAPGSTSPKHFAESVAIDGDVLVVGNREDKTIGNNSGAAYVYERVAGVWTFVTKLVGSDGAQNDLSADAVAVQGDRIVMGSYRNNASSSKSGAAYVFDKLGGAWQETQKLVALDSGGEMSRSIGLDGDRILLGARLADGVGAGYVFELQAGVWSQTAKLTGSVAGSGDFVGESCGLDGNRLVLSAHLSDAVGPDSGRAFVFELNNGTWSESDVLVNSDTAVGDQFSISVAISGDIILACSPFQDSSKGAGYFFSYDPVDCGMVQGTVMRYGDGLGGANIGDLSLVGTPNAGNPITFVVSDIPSGTNGFFWLSLTQTATPFRGGTQLSQFSGAPVKIGIALINGTTNVPFNFPPISVGFTVYAQSGAFDATQTQGVALTNGLEITVGG